MQDISLTCFNSKLSSLPRLPGDHIFSIFYFHSVCFHEVLLLAQMDRHLVFTKTFLVCSGYLESCEFFYQDVQLKLCECSIFSSKELHLRKGECSFSLRRQKPSELISAQRPPVYPSLSKNTLKHLGR